MITPGVMVLAIAPGTMIEWPPPARARSRPRSRGKHHGTGKLPRLRRPVRRQFRAEGLGGLRWHPAADQPERGAVLAGRHDLWRRRAADLRPARSPRQGRGGQARAL